MLYRLFSKLKEATISILPVALIVFILNLTPLINLSPKEIIVFLVSSVLLIIGISLFNLGADLAMQPMGEQVGSSLTKTKKILLILFVCFVLGVLITIAEPDLTVLAEQAEGIVPSTVLIVVVGLGVGLFLVFAIMKIIFKTDLSTMMIFFYMVLFAFTSLLILGGKEELLALAFDSGGVTTGPITVPFIMALGVGISLTIGGKKANENSFGLIALCSIGPIIALIILGLCSNGIIKYNDPKYFIADNVFSEFGVTSLSVAKEVLISLGLIVVFFFIIQFIYIKLPKKKLLQIGIGILYSFIGLVIFLTAVNVAFVPIGYKMGTQMASNPTLLAVFGFVIGCVVVLAEPAIHVLTKQVEEITNGGVSKKSMLIALCIGVGISICLSMIRIIFDFSILFYLIPGYFISLGLSFFVPKMYTAIAFDSGGVASGPLTSSFILPFAIGACLTLQSESKVLIDAFGIVSMVAMTPLISIQLLGFKSIVSSRVRSYTMIKKILSSDDEQIIYF